MVVNSLMKFLEKNFHWDAALIILFLSVLLIRISVCFLDTSVEIRMIDIHDRL